MIFGSLQRKSWKEQKQGCYISDLKSCIIPLGTNILNRIIDDKATPSKDTLRNGRAFPYYKDSNFSFKDGVVPSVSDLPIFSTQKVSDEIILLNSIIRKYLANTSGRFIYSNKNEQLYVYDNLLNGYWSKITPEACYFNEINALLRSIQRFKGRNLLNQMKTRFINSGSNLEYSARLPTVFELASLVRFQIRKTSLAPINQNSIFQDDLYKKEEQLNDYYSNLYAPSTYRFYPFFPVNGRFWSTNAFSGRIYKSGRSEFIWIFDFNKKKATPVHSSFRAYVRFFTPARFNNI